MQVFRFLVCLLVDFHCTLLTFEQPADVDVAGKKHRGGGAVSAEAPKMGNKAGGVYKVPNPFEIGRAHV